MGRKRLRPAEEKAEVFEEAEVFAEVEERLTKRKSRRTDKKRRKRRKEGQGIDKEFGREHRDKRKLRIKESHKVDKKSKPKVKASKSGDQEHNPKSSKKSSRKRNPKDRKHKKSKSSQDDKHIANDLEDKDMEEEIRESSEADRRVPLKMGRKQLKLLSRKSEEDDSLDERRNAGVENVTEVSLMSRRMIEIPGNGIKGNSEASGNNRRSEDPYVKFKLKTEKILEEKSKGVIGNIKKCTDRIYRSAQKQTRDYGKHFLENVRKLIEKENKKGSVEYKDKILKTQTFLKRYQFLEKQLARAETRSSKLSEKARLCETATRDHNALESEFKSVCEHNTKLQTELSEVKQKFQDQLTEKVAEVEVLKEVRTSLTSKAKDFREENEKTWAEHRVNYDAELNTIREAHAKEIGKLQFQCSELTISNLDLNQKNKHLTKILKENKIDSTVFGKSVAKTPERGSVAGKSVADEAVLPAVTPFSGHRKEFFNKQFNCRAREISMLRADITSLRVSLETKAAHLSELRKICNIYLILTGLRITKNELYFQCLAQSTEARVKFLFSLICHDNGSSLLYENNSWEAQSKCPAFLNESSGQFFERKVAPLFLKNVINLVFSPDNTVSEKVIG